MVEDVERRSNLAEWFLVSLLHLAASAVLLSLSSWQREQITFAPTEHGVMVLRTYDALLWTLLFPFLTFERYLHGWLARLAFAANSVGYGWLVLLIASALARRVQSGRGTSVHQAAELTIEASNLVTDASKTGMTS
jgi:hypothetical protein